jgi:ADP-heptose:LPS heptosyltransferase/O-antigen ligase
MTLQATAISHVLDRARWARVAEGLAIAVTVSLPWSTTATAILIVLWLIAVLPVLDPAAVRRVVLTPAGGLPVALWLLAAAGMLWADVSWAERFAGLVSFHKLLLIPLLLAQFQNSDRGMWVLAGFLVSCALLLATSLLLALWPGMAVRGKDYGVPVKDHILQSGEFVLCAFAILPLAFGRFRVPHARLALGLLALAGLFLADVLFVIPARTALVMIAVLLVLFAFCHFGWKGALGILVAALILAAIGWVASPNLRSRVTAVAAEFQRYQVDDARTSTGERVDFWRKSIRFIADAPVLGHGTGSIHDLFRRIAVGEGEKTISSLATTNPHNQALAVALQLGLLGVAVLLALWVAHLLLFRGECLAAWIGLVVVVQNIAGSLFNSHLFDFAQGWIYVFGVGVAGGMALRQRADARVMNRIALPERPRILVVALRRLGDVLLTTPLIRSLRRAWPDATIDALVFADTTGILAGNPDLDRVIAMPARPTMAESIALARRLWNRYALAVSTQAGDRPTFFAWTAGRQSVAPVERRLSGFVKRLGLQRSIPVAAGMHRVEDVLQLAKLLGIEPVAELVAPQGGERVAPDGPYAVIHAAPMFRYKRWTREGWRALAGALASRGLAIVATGGPADAERRYLDDLWRGIDVRRTDGRSWPELATLLAGARLYVGPDTSVTHLAAASGCPTVALYGPTDPRLWAPWPVGGLAQPWAATGAIQHRGNVWLVQNALPCTPCQLEGCSRHLESHSQCLDELTVQHVLRAADQALVSRFRSSPMCAAPSVRASESKGH